MGWDFIYNKSIVRIGTQALVGIWTWLDGLTIMDWARIPSIVILSGPDPGSFGSIQTMIIAIQEKPSRLKL